MVDDWRDDVVEQVRADILAGAPDAVEERKWKKPSNPNGVPTFSCDGLICTVETYKEKVKLTFAKGGSLPDPTGLFVPSAGVRRAIDIRRDDHVDHEALTELVRAAVERNRG